MADEKDWMPDRWWRVLAEDGSLWAETSNEAEARLLMRPSDTLHRLYQRVEVQWVEQPLSPATTSTEETRDG